jgi:hypothetical protein
MKFSKTMRNLGWIAFFLMWIPFLTLLGLPSGEYAWSELPQLTQYGMVTSGLLCAASTLLLVGAPMVSALRNRAVLEDGLPAQATIVEISDTGTTINNDPVVRLLLEVQTPGGVPFRAETERLISRLDIPQFQPGTVVQVRYDPDSGEVAVVDD